MEIKRQIRDLRNGNATPPIFCTAVLDRESGKFYLENKDKVRLTMEDLEFLVQAAKDSMRAS